MLERLMSHKLDRRNIVKFFESFETSRGTALVFEPLDISLHSYIHSNHPLSLNDIRLITQQAATALDALKSIQIIHGDVKPDNIMIVDREIHPLKVKLIRLRIGHPEIKDEAGHVTSDASVQTPWEFCGRSMDDRRKYTYSSLDSQKHVCLLKGNTDIYTQEQMIELLKAMLHMNWTERITPSEVLRHPFFEDGYHNSGTTEGISSEHKSSIMPWPAASTNSLEKDSGVESNIRSITSDGEDSDSEADPDHQNPTPTMPGAVMIKVCPATTENTVVTGFDSEAVSDDVTDQDTDQDTMDIEEDTNSPSPTTLSK
ncbi:homeodomain-interacting protein kinase 1-like isoform X4 [Scomber scombrus]|uniref:Homeodomain-interacting protein kinase 1-like isoform X4 n=1 Tax=Scomber scombrus TaxID=13677 RepID=A0AAV1PRL3_SCOSC